jgi:hypothetical protein
VLRDMFRGRPPLFAEANLLLPFVKLLLSGARR